MYVIISENKEVLTKQGRFTPFKSKLGAVNARVYLNKISAQSVINQHSLKKCRIVKYKKAVGV